MAGIALGYSLEEAATVPLKLSFHGDATRQ
jgi:hypothetical protein